jgi:hypothetical protein
MEAAHINRASRHRFVGPRSNSGNGRILSFSVSSVKTNDEIKARKRIVLMRGELVFLASANTTLAKP